MNTSRVIEVGVDTGLEGFNAGKGFIRSAVFDATTLSPGQGGINEVQTLNVTGTPTGGNLTLKWKNAAPVSVPFNATAAQIETLLEGIAGIGAGDVDVTGGPLPGSPVVITFINDLGHADQPLLVVNASGLTGGTSPAATVVETTKGNGDTWDPRILVGSAAKPVTPVMSTGTTPNKVKIWDGASATTIVGLIDGVEEFIGTTSACDRNVALYGQAGLVVNAQKVRNYTANKANFDTWAAANGVKVING